MAFDFFFKVDAGAVILASTDWLSPKTNVGSLIVMPIIHSLYLKPRAYSVACFIATNSLPKVLVLQEVCFFKLQYIGAQFRKTTKLVWDQRVTKSPAWLLSTNILIVIDGPNEDGMLFGSSSFNSSQP
jgi:hypothetical protein